MNKYKKFIKELGEVNPRYISKLEVKEKFPELFEVKLEVGKWYKFKTGKEVIVFYLKESAKNNAYGMWNGHWTEGNEARFSLNDTPDEWEPATNKEVEEMLIKEAKKRGLIDCFEHTCVDTTSKGTHKRHSLHENKTYTYDRSHDFLCDGWGSVIFQSGKWSKVINKPLEQTMEQVSEKYGREVKIVKE